MMDMGLDDIIRNKRGKKFAGRGGGGGGPRRGGMGRRQKGVVARAPIRSSNNNMRGRLNMIDARNKIIQKTRSKIVDARERIMQIARQSDAREKIMRRKSYDELLATQIASRNRKLSNFSYQQRALLPRRTISNKEAGVRTYGREEMLYRTVENNNSRRGVMISDDAEMADVWNTASVPRLQIHLQNSVENIHRTLRTSSQADDSWLRPAPNKQSILTRRTDDVKSRLEPVRGTPLGQEGYRIVVSNLQPTVTHEDIKELFEDIGSLLGSRVVRPGTAEVIYKNMDDAVTAVDTYHNRQLDGQPMKCMLVKPTNVKGVGSTKGSIVPDLHAIHKALFNK